MYLSWSDTSDRIYPDGGLTSDKPWAGQGAHTRLEVVVNVKGLTLIST